MLASSESAEEAGVAVLTTTMTTIARVDADGVAMTTTMTIADAAGVVHETTMMTTMIGRAGARHGLTNEERAAGPNSRRSLTVATKRARIPLKVNGVLVCFR